MQKSKKYLLKDRRRLAKRQLKKHFLNVNRNSRLYEHSKRFSLKLHLWECEKRLYSSRKNNLFEPFINFINIKFDANYIKIPQIFSLESNYGETIKTICNIFGSLYNNIKEIELDFSDTNKVDVASLFLLQILKKEITDKLLKFQKRLNYYSLIPKFLIIKSKSKNVNRIMNTCDFPHFDEVDENLYNDTKLSAESSFGFFKGEARRKVISENRKSECSKRIVKYINHCLSHHEYVLTTEEMGNFDGISGEVLSNCEDHSSNGTWFVHANFSKEDGAVDDTIGELNLTILNFGNSIYESILPVLNVNEDCQNLIDYADFMVKKFGFKNIEQEQYVTLGLMTEGTSRFSHINDSRGTGTVKFLNSFIELGDFYDEKLDLKPDLRIYSGNTLLVCDKDYKPFFNDGVYFLSLNKENDMELPPDSSHLLKLSSKFAGTLICIKLYFNKTHFDRKHGV